MNGELLGWIIGLAVTVVPLAITAWWGTSRPRRRFGRLIIKLTADTSRAAVAFRNLGITAAAAFTGMQMFTNQIKRAADLDTARCVGRTLGLTTEEIAATELEVHSYAATVIHEVDRAAVLRRLLINRSMRLEPAGAAP